MFLSLLLIQQFSNTSKLLFNGLLCKNANPNNPVQIWIFNSKETAILFPLLTKLRITNL